MFLYYNLQTGSIEITDIRVNEALANSKKELNDLKKEWFEQVEKDSESLYKIAEEASKNHPGMKVVILKRLPRYDRPSDDILGIKSRLSNYANSVYDQLWLKNGSPENIQIVELEFGLQSAKTGYLKEIIFGKNKSKNYDGYHLNGEFALRHFTYRAVQAIQPITRSSWSSARPANHSDPSSRPGETDNYHRNCPQSEYMRKSPKGHIFNDQSGRHQTGGNSYYQQMHRGYRKQNSYAETVKQGQSNYEYSIPTQNRFSTLN